MNGCIRRGKQEGMRASIPYTEKKFNDFNKQMFGGELKPLPFKLSHARSFLGQIRCSATRNPLTRKKHYSGFVFVISDALDIEENALEDIILHEMIHYYILSHQISDTSSHGTVFKRMMNEINTRFNRHITVKYRMTDDDLYRYPKRQHCFGIVRFKRDCRLGIIHPAGSKLSEYWDFLAKSGAVEECKWYTSSDPFFNRFPKTRTMKIYNITEEEIAAHLKDARELINNGKYIFLKSKLSTDIFFDFDSTK